MNYPVPHNHYQQDTGLNGFWGWLKRNKAKIIGILSVVYPPAAGVFAVFMHFAPQGDAKSITDTDLPLTPLDEANLDNWADNNFIPYFKGFVDKLQEYKIQPPKVVEFISHYNKVNLLIAFLENQRILDTLSGVSGLTANAVTARNKFIEIQIEVIKELLLDHVKNQNISITTQLSKVNVSTSLFSALGFNTPTILKLSYQEVKSVNNDSVDYEDVEANDNVSITTPINQNPKPTTTTTKKIFMYGFIGLLLNKIFSNNN